MVVCNVHDFMKNPLLRDYLQNSSQNRTSPGSDAEHCTPPPLLFMQINQK